MKYRLLFMLICLSLGFTTKALWAEPNENEKMLFKVPLSGPLSDLGQEARQGAELALKTWGGGLEVEIIDEGHEKNHDIRDLIDKAPIIVGYFKESNFLNGANSYSILRAKPVILPFFMTDEPSLAGPDNFFQLMPTFHEQATFMGLTILNMRRKPRTVLIITNDESPSPEDALAQTLFSVLTEGPQETAPPASGQKTPLPKPLDKNALVLSVTSAEALNPEGIAALGTKVPDIIVLAVDYRRALRLASWLAASKYNKAPIWGSSSLAFRDVGAAFNTLKLNLHLALPVDLANEKNKAVADFNRDYLAMWKTPPTWLSAISYDAMNLAVKAVSAHNASVDILTFLSGYSHHSLNVYQLASGGQGKAPVEFMVVTEGTLAYLP
ncbi:MAG: ABC transporter substrate-binding protein [Candidatus Adiutrix sp.]